MKEATIITNFQRLDNQIKRMNELVQQNFRQLYMTQTAISFTIDALTKLLIEKGVFTIDELKVKMEAERQAKMGGGAQNHDKNLEEQPTIDSNAEMPSPGEGEE